MIALIEFYLLVLTKSNSESFGFVTIVSEKGIDWYNHLWVTTWISNQQKVSGQRGGFLSGQKLMHHCILLSHIW